ncbi:MAG: PrpR N-terminal domain-containing protein [Anaerococcus vaginalis]|uniref:sigma-54-dependent Fis family transcriptional regulator n=1 Tax=Anaerococcus vaginalis TaxID=33037 RepID=UPI002908FFA5|nr:PrpR N-terminal domain-containing protein [Anaerococcus vaginalis]MDU7650847.1 PrpR N-terminal domain-containing protein [Anaerococcus vaginalis]
MKIYIVAPYSAMEVSLKKIKNNYDGVTIDYGIGNIYDGLKLAKNAGNMGYDAIISRGGTAKIIKKYMNIPLVDMKLSGNDILKAILLANNGHRTAIVAYPNITTGAKEIIELLNLDMKIYTINDDTNITQLLIKLKKEKIDQILGDIVAVSKAKELMFETILFQSSYETIKISIDYAVSLINQLNKQATINIIRSKFFEKSCEDYCILKGDRIFQSKYLNYECMPISYENLIGLKYKNKNKYNSQNTIYIDYSDKLQIQLNRIMYNNDYFYLFKFKKLYKDMLYPEGIISYTPNILYRLVYNSKSMKKALEECIDLSKKKTLLVLSSNDYFTIENFLAYIHNHRDNTSNSILVDLKIFKNENIKTLSSYSVKNIIFNNITTHDQLNEIKKLSNISNKQIIIITNESNWIQDEDFILNTIILPKTKERKEDIVEIFDFYISYYHNNKGTTPLKMKEDFICDFDKIENETIYDLIKVLDSIINNSKDLVIGMDEFESRLIKSNIDLLRDISNFTLEEVEYKIIKLCLEKEEYNQTKAADSLGISRATLWRKMKKYNL